MRLWLLSALIDSPGNARVLDAAGRAGHAMELVHPDTISLLLPGTDGALGLLRNGEAVAPPERVLTRLGSSAPDRCLDLLTQLETLGIPCINASSGLRLARDKAKTFQALARARLPLPATILIGRRSGGIPKERVTALLGPPPWIVKLPVSTQGLGVTHVESAGALRSLLDLLEGLDQRVLVQRLVAEAAGTDIRVLVINGKARAAMRRTAAAGELRSNLHRGGSAEPVTLDPTLSDVAERAAAALGLAIAGVDLLPSGAGPVVIEVNGSPGLEGLETATKLDLASELIGHLVSNDLAG